MLFSVLGPPFLLTLRRDNKSVREDFLGHMVSLTLPLWVELIITLLIHRNITQIQENTTKKQTQGKSTSLQQMVTLFVIMQRSRVQKYLHSQTASMNKESWGRPSRRVDGLHKFLGGSVGGMTPCGRHCCFRSRWEQLCPHVQLHGHGTADALRHH